MAENMLKFMEFLKIMSCFGSGAVVDQLLVIVTVHHWRTAGGHRLMAFSLVLEETVTQHSQNGQDGDDQNHS